MNTSTIVGIFTIFSFFWGGGLWIKDNRDAVRSADVLDSLTVRMEKEVERSSTVYSLSEQEDIISRELKKGFKNQKIYLDSKDEEQKEYFNKQLRIHRKEIKEHKAEMERLRAIYGTAYFEDAEGEKFILLGQVYNNEWYILKEFKVDKFDFEEEEVKENN